MRTYSFVSQLCRLSSFFYASFVNVPNSLESVTSRSQLHVFEFCMPARVIDLRISQIVVTANGFLWFFIPFRWAFTWFVISSKTLLFLTFLSFLFPCRRRFEKRLTAGSQFFWYSTWQTRPKSAQVRRPNRFGRGLVHS